MFVEDGSVLQRRRWPWQKDTLAFGGLDGAHPFRSGTCPAEVVDALEEAARHPVDQTRGHHVCVLCPPREVGPTPHETAKGDVLQLGSASIEVMVDGTRWVAPTLVLHYVAVHHYQPPEAVLHALRE